jgi:UDP-N-acetyl-2-amino-2-deoxyglucuronate dehydrogenase
VRLRVGFVGGGGITQTHARAARDCPDLEIAAFCGTNAAKIAALVAEHGGEAFDRVEDMLARAALDLVVIGSPSGRHAEQGLAAVRKGVHVLVEKPIDLTTERADALVVAAESAGVRLGVLFQDRLKPALVRLKDAVDAGAVGRPLLASARVKWHRAAWRSRGPRARSPSRAMRWWPRS